MTAKWLKSFGLCEMCGKKAEGRLMDERNSDLGPHCQKCADKRIWRDKHGSALHPLA